MFPPDFRLFLASQSPRRSALLRDLGVPIVVVPAEADEATKDGDPAALAVANARRKVEAAVLPADADGAFVLGADTVVVAEGDILGKPRDRNEARHMLMRLAGREHDVVSGVCLRRCGGRTVEGNARTLVRFADLSDAQVDAYLDVGEWRGKAGAYAIQGLAGVFVEGISGEYANVVGLPIRLVYTLFREFGFDLVAGRWEKGSR